MLQDPIVYLDADSSVVDNIHTRAEMQEIIWGPSQSQLLLDLQSVVWVCPAASLHLTPCDSGSQVDL